MQQPRVTIVVPVRNRARLLPQTLASVSGQTYAAWDCVIVDDASTDGSLEVAQSFAARDPRFKVLRRLGNTPGASVCRNEGLRHARGEYLIFLDSDDTLHASCLAGRVQALDAAPHLAFGVFLGLVFQNDPGDRDCLYNVPTGEPDLDRFLRGDNPWGTLHVLWRSEALAQLRGWSPELPSWQDWELHTRALNSGLEYAKYPLIDCYVRMKGSDRSSIGNDAAARSHLVVHSRLLACMTRELRRKGELSASRRRALAQKYAELAARSRKCGDLAWARHTCVLMARLGLISWPQAALGAVCFGGLELPGARYVAGHFLLPRWVRRNELAVPSTSRFRVRVPYTPTAS
jgi:glycosyltransferase involved in cell wall biosynthesis